MIEVANELEIVAIDDSLWCDVVSLGGEGGMCNVGIANAKTEKVAYKRAAKEFRRLADVADELAEEV